MCRKITCRLATSFLLTPAFRCSKPTTQYLPQYVIRYLFYRRFEQVNPDQRLSGPEPTTKLLECYQEVETQYKHLKTYRLEVEQQWQEPILL
jgi:hypothetical protein